MREEKADKEIDTSTATILDGANANPVDNKKSKSRSRSRRRAVTDTGQTTSQTNVETLAVGHRHEQQEREEKIPTRSVSRSPPLIHVTHDNEDFMEKAGESTSERPAAGGVVFPFKLSTHLRDDNANASTITLKSQADISAPKVVETREVFDAAPSAVGAGSKSEVIGVNTKATQNIDQVESADSEAKRPEMERFVTAAEVL